MASEPQTVLTFKARATPAEPFASDVVTRRLTAPLGLRDGVRLADEGDAHAVAWLRTVSWQVAAEQGLLAATPDLGVFPTVVRTFQTRLRAADLTTFVALRGGEIVGYAMVRHEGLELTEVISAHVHPAHWHARVGENLALAVSDRVRSLGRRVLRIEVASDNAATQHQLVRYGFCMYDKTVRRCHVHHRYVMWLGGR
jgi:ribosomal protein S18 acetylase RimI-like enzyme